MTELQATLAELDSVIDKLAALSPNRGLYIEDMDSEGCLYSFDGADLTDEGNIRLRAYMWSLNEMAKSTGLFRGHPRPTSPEMPVAALSDRYIGTVMQRQDEKLYSAVRQLALVASKEECVLPEAKLIDVVSAVSNVLSEAGVPVCHPWSTADGSWCNEVNWGAVTLPCGFKSCMCKEQTSVQREATNAFGAWDK